MANWKERAACRGQGIAAWFSRRNTPEQESALQTCATCPVRSECLAHAQKNEDTLRYGVFGGVAPAER